jgi:hypothetical protein
VVPIEDYVREWQARESQWQLTHQLIVVQAQVHESRGFCQSLRHTARELIHLQPQARERQHSSHRSDAPTHRHVVELEYLQIGARKRARNPSENSIVRQCKHLQRRHLSQKLRQSSVDTRGIHGQIRHRLASCDIGRYAPPAASGAEVEIGIVVEVQSLQAGETREEISRDTGEVVVVQVRELQIGESGKRRHRPSEVVEIQLQKLQLRELFEVWGDGSYQSECAHSQP